LTKDLHGVGWTAIPKCKSINSAFCYDLVGARRRGDCWQASGNAMSGDISIDLGSALSYLEQRILGLFGKDAAGLDWQNRLKDMIRLSAEQARQVQCVGMHTPIPIERIYQPTRLKRSDRPDHEVDAGTLATIGKDSLIFAGPGWGKTTLLHHLYCELALRQDITPILFTLRWPGVPKDLAEFIERLAHSSSTGKAVLLLVDGYDEISEEERQDVSRALVLFQSLKRGTFLLTCRTFYHVYEIKAVGYNLSPFRRDDAQRFVRAFSGIYGVPLDEEATIAELEQRGFSEFLAHPLMLTLVCILKTGPNQEIPRRAIGLIRRALETLTFRWDEAKRVRRESYIPLDGEERVRCLMSIAYGMGGLAASSTDVERLIQEHLRLIQVSRVSSVRLLDELAKWYGILVPVDDSRWQFVHRTIQDYLAARYWVESGEFMKAPVQDWNIRAGYAACLLPDATACVARMLSESRDVIAFRECLYNRAPFDVVSVSKMVVSRAEQLGNYTMEQSKQGIHVNSSDEFFVAASPEFLRSLVEIASAANATSGVACTRRTSRAPRQGRSKFAPRRASGPLCEPSRPSSGCCWAKGVPTSRGRQQTVRVARC
jgi:hypothetical protein